MIHTVTRGVDKNCPKTGPPVPLTMEQLRGLFWQYDANRDGRLSKEELKAAFNRLGACLPGWRARRALKRADDNGDGYISEEEVDELVKYAVKLGYVLK